MKLHAIILALNEEKFIKAQIDAIYPFCSGISIISQYDRDWYGKPVMPDFTIDIVKNYPDPEGKINLIVRRLPDEAAARNMEMLSFTRKSYKSIKSHGNPIEKIANFHNPPDYFWIIDADEIYDIETIPNIIEYLGIKKPKGMRIRGYNYLRTWNRRVPPEVVNFIQFGFIKPGLLFEQRRVISWNESRISKLFQLIKIKDFSADLYGFITCPDSIGVFHHACWIGDNERIRGKFQKSSHMESQEWASDSVDTIQHVFIPTQNLPVNIRNAEWPKSFFDEQ